MTALERAASRLREAAARYAEQPAGEPLHDLRVALRRATAAAGLFGDFPRDGDGQALRRRARGLRRRLSAARQQEVSTELVRGLTSGRLAAAMAKVLEGNAPPETSRVVRLALGIAQGLTRWKARFERSGVGSPEDFAERLTRRVRKRRKALLSAGVPGRSELHALRIAGKAFRYQLEILEEVDPRSAELLPACRRFQEALGTAHDHDCLEGDVTTAISRLPEAQRKQAEGLLPALKARRRETFWKARREARRFLRVLQGVRPRVEAPLPAAVPTPET